MALFQYRSSFLSHLLEDTGDETSGNGASTLTHVESLAGLEHVWLVQLADHLDVVTRHDLLVLLDTLGPGKRAALVCRSDEHLGPVVLAEASVATTFLLAQHVHGDKELLVCLDGSRDGNDHTTANILTLNTTEEKTGVVTCAGLFAGLLEGLNIGDLGLYGSDTLADELNLGIPLQGTTLDTTRADGSTSSDGEDIFDGHEERLVGVTLGCGDPGVDVLKELVNLLLADLRLATFEGAQRRAHHDGSIVTLKAVRSKQLAHLHLNELQHLLVLNGVHLVYEDNNLLDTNLTGEKQVLTGLGHLSVRGGNNDDGAVHVRGTRNHVLDVIGVTGAVNVGIVPIVGRVLDVCCGNGDTALSLFRGLVDGAIFEEFCVALLGLSLCDSSCEGGLLCSQYGDVDLKTRWEACLSVIDVTNSTYCNQQESGKLGLALGGSAYRC